MSLRLVEPPSSEAELSERVAALAGQSLAEVAAWLGVDVPPNLKRHKGWVGNLMEQRLGATAASRDEPDFQGLGIELKTLPVNRRGKPLETTFVATIPLSAVGEMDFADSRVWRKLRRVLWLPILAERSIPLADRLVGNGFLWRPSEEQRGRLRHDWEHLAGLIGSGQIEAIHGGLGSVMQVRPKAANSRVRRQATDAEGLIVNTLPRGFYLRTQFTASILRSAGL